MAPLKFIVLVCALLAAQTQAHPQAAVGASIVDILKLLLEPTEKLIDYVFAEGGDLIIEVSKDTEGYRQKAVDITSKGIDLIWNSTETFFDLTIEKGDENTKVVLGCVKASESGLKELPLTLFDESTKCILSDVIPLFKLSAELQPEVRATKDAALKAANGLLECKGNALEESACALRVGLDVVKVVTGMPQETKDKLKELADGTLNLLTKILPPCVKTNAEIYKASAVKLVDEVSACSRK
ncbi:hypothetical protein JTB14_005195 [Gonioctena quinquepunctata]|nr:hypothetical protein JTB14_005195 [Gonioctena quinquepunctata]